MLTPYGRSTLLWYAFGLCVVLAALFIIGMNPAVQYSVLTIAAAATFLVLNFFRDPERTVPAGEDLVIAPADGRIISVGPVTEPVYINGAAIRVCIFMSPLDVHVNRFPVSGRIGYMEHVPGRFTAAFRDKASEDNERTLIGIERRGVKILFKQISGALARRIVADVTVGQQAVAGERFGMIKFGSRVDVLMPPSAEVAVRVNDRAVAGQTILAMLAPAA
ncbi:MAG TPA: phosphatidylserine decarboxylase family protein [Bacteroidota bacterium]|nr:phosphatidylserine decarboxylase family protein [Bacteroidota bacterium]